MPASNVRTLPYFEDSQTVMRALSALEMPAFLDSANSPGDNGNRDILAAAPLAFLSIAGGVLSSTENIESNRAGSMDSGSFFSYIRKLKDQYLPIPSHSALSESALDLCGAVIGNIGYPELSGRSKFIIQDAFVGFYPWTLVIDHDKRQCTLRFHPKYTSRYIDEIHAAIEGAIRGEQVPERDNFGLTSAFASHSSFEDYRTAFSDIKARIERGDCYQVNLTQGFTAQCEGDPLAAYFKLRSATNVPFSAYINWGTGALLSLSPERFVRLRGEDVLTQPIKGTRPRGPTKAEDFALATELSASEKDTAENLMIVDLLRNDIGKVCETGSIDANQIFTVESFSNVHHLVSNVTGKLNPNKDGMDLLEACYPGGSITGAPKLSAMHIIRELEQAQRRVYCGSVFCWGSEGNLDSSITIRSLLWQASQICCWAGGGIVADSDCEQEYQECFDKIANIFNALEERS